MIKKLMTLLVVILILLAATGGVKIHIWRAEDGALLYIGKTAG